MKKNLFWLIFVALPLGMYAQSRWTIAPDQSIVWRVGDDIPHDDHIEMSGEKVSVVLRYGVKADGSFGLERSMVWPMLRTIPNDTHASLMQRFAVDYPSLILVNGRSLQNEKVKTLQLDGRLTVVSEYAVGYPNLASARPSNPRQVVELTRVFFPSTTLPMVCERYVIKNISDRNMTVNMPASRTVYQTDASLGVDGSYTMVAELMNGGIFTLKPNETCTFDAVVKAYKSSEQEMFPDVAREEQARRDFVQEVWSKLVFESPDPVLNTAFAFAKIRASESIYKTKGGYMHGPGGESYYAAIWANDQAEYVNPFFPYLGYVTGNKSAFNAFQHFARFMNDEYKPIPSSIIAEGIDIWHGAGDRGDGAMIAYGAARYALTKASREEAEALWPLIEWCLEFCKRKLTDDGVVASNSDELEGRFPAGKANLCTSSLYYDALVSASFLARELRKGKQASEYEREAKMMKSAINRYFGANVEGFETYRYYDGNDVLRSWICIPLTMGIFERKEGTIEALFSPRLWTQDGMLTQAGSETFWDRSALYALRGVFAAGAREKATEYLKHYSGQRLLGEHVPYPIEAWPEGSQRHLSAESGLYCRIITEGLFGIRPTGFSSFDLTPQLPEGWDRMALREVYAFGTQPFSIIVERSDKNLKVHIERSGKRIQSHTCKTGQTVRIKLTIK